ncbi:MAG TPA: YciI family protein [Acetobacteraceae bacterium]|jgi:hypothetical protein|nr:YciI family protein [Acetobacteraceae bacterium]
MRFMLLRKADAKTEAGVLPKADLLEAMGHYIQDMAAADILLSGEGLQASSKGARVRFVDGTPAVELGAFAAPETLLSGYFVIQVASLDDAIAWVKRWPRLDGDGSVDIEIRQLFEADDFGSELSPELRKAESCLRARAA